MYKFTFKQIFLGIFNFLFFGPSHMFNAILMADPKYREADKAYRKQVVKLQRLQKEYAEKYPNSSVAYARQKEKELNTVNYQITQTILRGKK